MLYTTEQIAEMYSGKQQNVTAYMITHSWIPKGLKHIKGKGRGYLYKKEWVEEFLENVSIVKEDKKGTTIKFGKRRITNVNCLVH